MSSSTTSDDKQKSGKATKFALLAGVLAIGILAAALVGTIGSGQSLNAIAQTNDDGEAGIGSHMGMHPKDGYNNHNNYPNHNLSTLSTSGMATTKVKPDKFSVTAGVETNGTTAQEAASRNADLMDKVIAALKDLGVSEKEISTSNYNVYPVYEYREPAKVCPEIYPQPPYCLPGNVLTGYRASNSVTITLDVAGKIDAGKVIDATVKSGANNVNGVYFFISPDRQQAIRDDLIKDAVANAKHRAKVAADALEMAITGVQSVNLNDVYFPIFYGKSYDAGVMSSEGASAPTQILPGEQDVSTTVSVVFYIGSITTTTTTGVNGTSVSPSSSPSPSGMTSTKDNTNCTNPPGGPMIC